MSNQITAIIDSLADMRRTKGITQRELADMCGLTQSVIARLESKKSAPNLETVLKITEALGCELKIINTRPY